MNIGDKAPEILGFNENGEEIRLSAYQGKKIVLYFYPRTVRRAARLKPATCVIIMQHSARPVMRLLV